MSRIDNGVIFKRITYSKSAADILLNKKSNKASETTVTDTATFTNSTNNIALTGIGSIGLEIGDVVEVSGTASNNGLFSAEVLTDSGNVVFNQAHAGGTTTKSFVDETVSATVTLVSKWFNAQFLLGQGIVNLGGSRSLGATYTNNTGRAISASVRFAGATGQEFGNVTIDGAESLGTSVSGTNFSAIRNFTVPSGSSYSVTTGTLNTWSEVR